MPHVVHAMEPGEAYVPGSQKEQFGLPLLGWYWPPLQREQAAEPSPAYLPSTHVMQPVAEEVATYFPVPHAVHAATAPGE